VREILLFLRVGEKTGKKVWWTLRRSGKSYGPGAISKAGTSKRPALLSAHNLSRPVENLFDQVLRFVCAQHQDLGLRTARLICFTASRRRAQASQIETMRQFQFYGGSTASRPFSATPQTSQSGSRSMISARRAHDFVIVGDQDAHFFIHWKSERGDFRDGIFFPAPFRLQESIRGPPGKLTPSCMNIAGRAWKRPATAAPVKQISIPALGI